MLGEHAIHHSLVGRMLAFRSRPLRRHRGDLVSDAKRCDNCGIHGYEPYQGWLHFEALGEALLGRGDHERDFCSWSCVEQRAKVEQLTVEQRQRVGL